MCEFHDSNGNGFGDIWGTDKPIYFSIIDCSTLHAGYMWRSVFSALQARYDCSEVVFIETEYKGKQSENHQS